MSKAKILKPPQALLDLAGISAHINVKMSKLQCRFSDIMMQNCPCIAALSPKGLVTFKSIQFLVKRLSFFGHLVPEYPLVYTILTNWIQDRFNVQN